MAQVKRRLTAPVTKRAHKGFARARTPSAKDARKGYTLEMMPLLEENTKKFVTNRDIFDGGTTNAMGEFSAVEPPYPYRLLLQAARSNSALNQAIDAYIVNIESYGYQLEYVGPAGKEEKPTYQAEKLAALTLLDNPSGDRTLRKLREDSRKDLETLGTRYFEIGRDMTGRPTFIEHVCSMSMRKTKKDKEATEYELPIRTTDGRIVQRTWWKNFRRYVQAGANGKRVFFKEFGDPRSIDPKTGQVNNDLAIEDQATEIYVDEIYSVGAEYGIPRWIGALPDMLGLRESEIVNLNFFRENAIPAMAVLISGGALTEESYDKVVNVINAAKGQDSMHRILILEAASEDNGGVDDRPVAPKIELKPLTDRQSDGLFKEYQGGAKRKIRSTMRLPALFTGDTEEYTKATAQSGIRVAETQVFAPERSKFDDFINKYILPALGVTNWRFRSLGPTVYDPETLSLMVDRFGRQGAMTPNILIKIANQVLDIQIDSIQEDWGNVPFNYSLDMLAQGKEIKGFEKAFTEVQDALLSTPPVAGDAPANDNVAASHGNRIVRKNLVEVLDDLIDRIEQVELNLAA